MTVDSKKRSFTTGTKDYNEAKKKRATAVRELEQGRAPNDSGRKRLEPTTEEYIRHREETVAAGTVRIEKERLVPLLRELGNRMLREITPRTVREYQGARAKEVGVRTVNLEVKLLRGILKAECMWRRVAEDVKRLKEGGEAPGRALTSEETLTLFETAERKPE